jgi:hypothetical protein
LVGFLAINATNSLDSFFENERAVIGQEKLAVVAASDSVAVQVDVVSERRLPRVAGGPV